MENLKRLKFKKAVFEIVRKIPPGEVLSYKEVAEKAGWPRAWRAVGSILSKNFDKNIPCHRVICSSGAIGGYNRGKREKMEKLWSEGYGRRMLDLDFFERKTQKVARELLGKFLVRKLPKKEIWAMITEVEIYDGWNDKASHIWKGITKRSKIMLDAGGYFYVYLNYGKYWMLNIVTGEKGYPAAILIRGTDKVSGPGRLTKFFKINNYFNGKPALKKTGLWFEDRGINIKGPQIKKTSRVGVDYAGPFWAGIKRRYLL